jgi:hypothetical protein
MFILNILCEISPDKLPFTWFGLCLQEPMALVTNWLIALTSVYLYFQIKKPYSNFRNHWRKFYFYFAISTFFGGLGHLLFNYFDVFGKLPCWFFGVIASFHAGKAMISVNMLTTSLQRKLTLFLFMKGVILFLIGAITGSFIFIMIDAILSYLLFCLGFGAYYWRKGYDSFKFTVYAVIILFPSLFIFLLKLNPHLWFNKDDLSHVLMVLTIIFFYIGIRKFTKFESQEFKPLN